MIWFYLIVYGSAFGILSSIAVKKKNRDQGAWFFIGFLFGVFGLIAAVLVDKLESQAQPSHQSAQFDHPSTLTKKCPDCAETIKLQARVCRFCQHKFTEEEVAEQIAKEKHKYEAEVQAYQATLGSQWQCPNCYTFNKSDSPYCHRCQYSRDKALEPPRLLTIPCPNCDNKEAIPESNLFSESQYKSFLAKEGFFSGQWKLTCLQCNHTFFYDPYQLRDSKKM